MVRQRRSCALALLLLACSSGGGSGGAGGDPGGGPGGDPGGGEGSVFVDDEVPVAPPPQARAAYFTVDGTQQFVALRNLSGRSEAEIEELLDDAHRAGTTLVRIHLTHGSFGRGIDSKGEIDAEWAAAWERVFTYAAARGIQVIPVFGVWADFNDGSKGEPWHTWNENPLNAANGGPATSPAELYVAGSLGQRVWIRWLGRLVKRWQGHGNIAAWEVFSELNGVTRPPGDEAAFRAATVAFYEAAAARIRALDPLRRPVTGSTSDWWWPELYRSPAVELVQVHVYGDPAIHDYQFDEDLLTIMGRLRSELSVTKPILLGESGIDWHAPHDTDTTRPFAPIATRHAVWAELVAGAMNGRALWWEDAYAIFENGDAGKQFVLAYPDVEASMLDLLAGRDLAGFAAIPAEVSRGIGGVIGNSTAIVGWVRKSACSAPSWDCSSIESNASLAFTLPSGAATRWLASYHDPATGALLAQSSFTAAGPISVDLPNFSDDVAVVFEAQAP